MVQMESWGIIHQEQGWRKGPWTPLEDKLLIEYVSQNGEGRWSSVSKCTGLNRSGKSCRLRWVNYLRPGLKKGHLTPQEEGIIIELHAIWGNKWSTIARYLPGRTDNEIKNYWRTHFKKRKPSDRIDQEKRKIQRLRKHDDQQQRLETLDKNVITISESPQEPEITYSTTSDENNQFLLPMIHEDAFSWSNDFDYPVDCCLWGGLWNLGGCNRMGVQNQPNNNIIADDCYSLDGFDSYSVQGGGYIF